MSSTTSDRLRGVPPHDTIERAPTAICALPPASIATATRAPRSAMSAACSAAVTPGLPCTGPSAVTRRIVPAAVWPTAVRVVRPSVCAELSPSPALAIAFPSRTSSGPPPTALSTSGASGWESGIVTRPGVIVTRRPVSRSPAMVLPDEPTPVSTTWPRPIVLPPPAPVEMTVPVRAAPGVRAAAGSSRRTRASHSDAPVGVLTVP